MIDVFSEYENMNLKEIFYAQLSWKQILNTLNRLNGLNNNSNRWNINNISNDSSHKLSITEVGR